MIRYGERIGVAFQLSDDLLDVAERRDRSLARHPGTDLREGVVTLPVLHARRSIDPADARLLELLDGDLADAGRHRETWVCCARTRRSRPPVLTSTDGRATRGRRWCRFPMARPRRALEAMCDFVVARTR